MEEKIKLLTQGFGEYRIKQNEILANYVYSKLGGPAEIFFIATNQRELIEILDASWDLQIPFQVIGNGTKTVISLMGVSGLVIKNRTSNLKIGAVKGKVGRSGIGVEEVMVEVDSGVSIGKLNEFLNQQNLKIIEDLSLNATVGGSFGSSPILTKLAQKITIWDRREVSEISTAELKPNEQIILSTILKIKAAG